MGPPAFSLILFVVVVLPATLSAGPTMVHAEGSSAPDGGTPSTNITQVHAQCSQLQRRQDLLDNRMTERDTRLDALHTQLNGLNIRLNTRQSEVNTRFNRMDSRLDGIETAITDMKDFLQIRMEAMDKKVEWALTDIRPRQDVSTARPDTTSRQDVSTARPDTRPHQADTVTDKPQVVVYRGCQDVLARGANTSGIYTILPVDAINPINVFCEQRLAGGGWTVFQARKDGSVNFYNDWNTYKAGFGELNGEFWLGNTNIYMLTKRHDQELKIELTSPEGEVKFANYAQFWIEDEDQKYRLTVGQYSGGIPPGNSLAGNSGSRFSTPERDNDRWSRNCATAKHGAWWYSDCGLSNLNGSGSRHKARSWSFWKGHFVSMKATRMMFRKRP